MIKCMNKQERVEDIAKRCGLSKDIILSVLNAEAESMVEALKRGERVNLYKMASFTPEIKRIKLPYSIEQKRIAVNVVVSSAIEDELSLLSEFKIVEETDNIIRTSTIEALN